MNISINICVIVNVSHVLWKLGIMNICKVSTQISLCSPRMLIRDDTFRLHQISVQKRPLLNKQLNKSGKYRPWSGATLYTHALSSVFIERGWLDNIMNNLHTSPLYTLHLDVVKCTANNSSELNFKSIKWNKNNPLLIF